MNALTAPPALPEPSVSEACVALCALLAHERVTPECLGGERNFYRFAEAVAELVAVGWPVRSEDRCYWMPPAIRAQTIAHGGRVWWELVFGLMQVDNVRTAVARGKPPRWRAA